MDDFELKIGELQRKLRARGIPLLIIFEGPSAAGRGRLISKLIHLFDSRGYNLVTGSVLSDYDSARLPMQKYWINSPENGRIAIFERSPYAEIFSSGIRKPKALSAELEYIKDFERTLAANGTAILKIFLEIGKKEQKKRLKELEKNKNSRWRVTKDDWRQNKNFDEYIETMDFIISESAADYAPWVRIDSSDLKSADGILFQNVAAFIEKTLSEDFTLRKTGIYTTSDSKTEAYPNLNNLDLSLKLTREAYNEKLINLQEEILQLELKAYKKKVPVIIVFEGCDAAGKGGAIRRLTQGLDPRGMEVIPVAAPNEYEKRHHYMWRFWRNFPKRGHFAVFDRSWYGRVLVERVEAFCPEADWRRAYAEINEMEKYLVNSGAVICKFWLHISQEEQLKRFNERQEKEYKNWKITEEDWRNREKWPQYKKAIEEMLAKTNSEYAPWTVVEAESKLYSRIKILSTLVGKLKLGKKGKNR